MFDIVKKTRPLRNLNEHINSINLPVKEVSFKLIGRLTTRQPITFNTYINIDMYVENRYTCMLLEIST